MGRTDTGELCYCKEVEEGTRKRCPTHHRFPCCMGSVIWARVGCTCLPRERYCKTCGQLLPSKEDRAETSIGLRGA